MVGYNVSVRIIILKFRKIIKSQAEYGSQQSIAILNQIVYAYNTVKMIGDNAGFFKKLSLRPLNKVLPVYTLGDVNSDGTVDARDASKVLTEYARFSTDRSYKPDEIFMLAADVNRNKIVDGNDATAIFTYYAKASAGKAGSFAEYIG